jgi:hypothetical protein
VNKFCVGDILINTELNIPYKITKTTGDVYSFDLYTTHSGWKPSQFDWKKEEIQNWILLTPVIKAIYED